jgi:cobalt/nickel transport system ATP-binding protein
MAGRLVYSDVQFSYPDGTVALEKVSFSLDQGEHVALLGPNGAGKSTVLLLANGVLLPSAGSILVGDLPLVRENLVAIRQRVGLVFQDPDDQLFMTSVADDLAFGLLNQGLDTFEVEQRVQSALFAVGLQDVAARAPQDLSFGQRKRAALATILAMQPEFLILDEPTSNLDPRGRRQMMQLLAGLESTMLIATHDLDLVWDQCSRVLIINAGQIVADGQTRELLRDQELLETHSLELPAAVRYEQE